MVTLAMRSFVSSTAVDLPVRITRLYVCIDVGLYMFIKVGTYMCIKVSLISRVYQSRYACTRT